MIIFLSILCFILLLTSIAFAISAKHHHDKHIAYKKWMYDIQSGYRVPAPVEYIVLEDVRESHTQYSIVAPDGKNFIRLFSTEPDTIHFEWAFTHPDVRGKHRMLMAWITAINMILNKGYTRIEAEAIPGSETYKWYTKMGFKECEKQIPNWTYTKLYKNIEK